MRRALARGIAAWTQEGGRRGRTQVAGSGRVQKSSPRSRVLAEWVSAPEEM